jgi:hypothetical protein
VGAAGGLDATAAGCCWDPPPFAVTVTDVPGGALTLAVVFGFAGAAAGFLPPKRPPPANAFALVGFRNRAARMARKDTRVRSLFFMIVVSFGRFGVFTPLWTFVSGNQRPRQLLIKSSLGPWYASDFIVSSLNCKERTSYFS